MMWRLAVLLSLPSAARSGNFSDGRLRARSCPDTDVLCRLSTSDASSLGSSYSCEAGVAGAAGGGVQVNGRCVTKTESWRGTTWFDVGTVQAGQCFDLFAGGCQVNNCGRTIGTICAATFDVCAAGAGSWCQGCQPGNPTYFPC
jgi:hypothetical protein